MSRSLLFSSALVPCILIGFTPVLPEAAVASPAPAIASTAADDAFQQGLTAYESGHLLEAIQAWQTALSLSDLPLQRAQTLGNLAIAYQETGQYLKALQANQDALAIFLDLGQSGAVGQVHNNLGNVYELLGDYDRAIAAYEQSRQIAQASGERQAEGISIGNLGYLYALQGHAEAALAAYRQSLAIAQAVGDREGEAHRLLNLGLLYHAQPDLPQAEQFYQRSLAVAREVDSPLLEARVLSNLGLVAADGGQVDVAIAYFEQSLAIAQDLQHPQLEATILNNLGHTLLTAQRLDEAATHLRSTIAYLDSLRTGLGDTLNVSVFDTQIYSYNLLQQVLVAQGKPEAALEVAEAGRSRAFTDLLAQRLPPSVAPSPNPGSNLPLRIDQIRQLAQQENATLVEYALVPEETFRVQGKQRGQTAEVHIWVVQPDGTIHFRRSAIHRQQPLEELVTTSHSGIGTRSRATVEVIATTPDDTAQNLATLHQILIDPIQDLLPDNPEDPIVFIPQGDLFLVPFPALITAHGDYLIQHHTLLTAPSIQVLALTHRQAESLQTAEAPEPALIVGNPTMPAIWDAQANILSPLPSLPGAEQEALQIAEFLGGTPLIAGAASEQSVKQRIGNARIVHLATHGLLEYGNPQESGIRDTPGAIALAPGQGQDGLLTSAEILAELNLQATLVVLSACDTGRGEITGDGVIGLSRSLIAAGTPSVVVSLWAIPDAPTAELMVAFYQALAQGQDKAQALRQAMLKTMAPYPDPKDWAAFTLIGAPE